MHHIDKTFNFADSVANQHGLKIISITYTMANAAGHRINIFQNRSVLRPENIVRNIGFNVTGI
ncbi:hypothetical protein D3C85_1537940 [compost metagenome]